jgi:hypothetical protein
MESYLQAIANFGFPIVVASFLLFRNDKNQAKLIEQVTILTATVQALNDKIDELCNEAGRIKHGSRNF